MMTQVLTESFSSTTSKKSSSLFMVNLHTIIESQKYSSIINWTNNGTFMTIFELYQFADVVLPMLCKHSNLSSFVRQLNMYNFKKIKSVQSEAMTYSHPCFISGRRDLLTQIVRKNPRVTLAQKQDQLKQLCVDTSSTRSGSIVREEQPQQPSRTTYYKQLSQCIDYQPKVSKAILSFMDELINDVSSKTDNKIKALVREFLKDDEDDNEDNQSSLRFYQEMPPLEKRIRTSPIETIPVKPTNAIPINSFSTERFLTVPQYETYMPYNGYQTVNTQYYTSPSEVSLPERSNVRTHFNEVMSNGFDFNQILLPDLSSNNSTNSYEEENFFDF